MQLLTCSDFAARTGIVLRVAQRAFARGTWRGHVLPVIELDGRRGGAGGKVWGLVLDRCAPELRAKLSPVPAVVAPVEAGVERPFNAWKTGRLPNKWHALPSSPRP